jgi:hypothetical protein
LYGNDDEPSTTHREVFFDIEIEMGGALTEEYIKVLLNLLPQLLGGINKQINGLS